MRNRLDEVRAAAVVNPTNVDIELGPMEATGLQQAGPSEFMGAFFAQVEDVKRGIAAVEQASRRIREITDERVLAVSQSAEEALSRELTPLVESSNRRLKATKELLERMAEETQQNKATLKQSEARIRENLSTTLHRKFGDVAKDYQRAQQQYKSEIQKTVKRQLEIVKPDISADEVDTVLRSGSAGGVYRQAILKGAADPIKAAYADVADKYHDVLKLEQSVAELHQMFLDFALLTEQQGELLDQIEYQVVRHTHVGTTTLSPHAVSSLLDRAEIRQRVHRRWQQGHRGRHRLSERNPQEVVLHHRHPRRRHRRHRPHDLPPDRELQITTPTLTNKPFPP